MCGEICRYISNLINNFWLVNRRYKNKNINQKPDISAITTRIDIVDDDVCRSVDRSMTTKRDDIDEKTDDIYELLMMKRHNYEVGSKQAGGGSWHKCKIPHKINLNEHSGRKYGHIYIDICERQEKTLLSIRPYMLSRHSSKR